MKDSDQLYIRVPEEYRAVLERARAEYEKRTGEHKSLAFIAREAMLRGLVLPTLHEAPPKKPRTVRTPMPVLTEEDARLARLRVAKAYKVRVFDDHTLVVPKGYNPTRKAALLKALDIFGSPFEVVDET